MKSYLVDEKKQKSVYNNYIKCAVWKQGWFVKFSYVFEKISLILGLILGVINVINVLFFSHEPLYLLFLIMTCGFPYGLSLIFKAVYKEWTIKEYKYRGFEKIRLNKEIFEYSFDSPLSNIRNVYTFNYSEVEKIEYASNLHMYNIQGNIKFLETVQGEIISEKVINEVSLLDVFSKDLKDCFVLVNNIKEI